MRFITFVIVMVILIVWYRLASRPPRVSGSKSKPQPKRIAPKGKAGEFWSQVYDTDSAQEARQIQQKFESKGVECFVYEQGKKDVYGNLLKRYGISVPQGSVEKAQQLLCESAP